MIGDHHQLGAIGPGGGLEALVARHHPAVVVLDQNVRQRDPAERAALEQLRAGDVGKAVAWYRDNGRIVAAPERSGALDAAVDAWDADRRAGHDVALLAWRRRDVAALNERARRRAWTPASSPVPRWREQEAGAMGSVTEWYSRRRATGGG